MELWKVPHRSWWNSSEKIFPVCTDFERSKGCLVFIYNFFQKLSDLRDSCRYLQSYLRKKWWNSWDGRWIVYWRKKWCKVWKYCTNYVDSESFCILFYLQLSINSKTDNKLRIQNYVLWVSENSVVFWRGRIYTDLTNVNGVWGNLELRFKSED